MSDAAPDTQPDRPTAPSRVEERMRLLRRMSEVGVRMAERLDRQSELSAACAEAEVGPEPHQEANARRLDEIARAFAQVSRAVSLSIALEDRLERGPPLPPTAERQPPALRLVEPDSNLGARREQAARAVRRTIDAEAAGDPRRTADLCLNLDRLLDRELAAVDAFLDRPLGETIARLRRDLGLADAPEAPAAQPSALKDPSRPLLAPSSWLSLSPDTALKRKAAGPP